MMSLTIQINPELAEAYRRAYERAFGCGDPRESTASFISRFTEDRLTEEIEFIDKEHPVIS